MTSTAFERERREQGFEELEPEGIRDRTQPVKRDYPKTLPGALCALGGEKGIFTAKNAKNAKIFFI